MTLKIGFCKRGHLLYHDGSLNRMLIKLANRKLRYCDVCCSLPYLLLGTVPRLQRYQHGKVCPLVKCGHVDHQWVKVSIRVRIMGNCVEEVCSAIPLPSRLKLHRTLLHMYYRWHKPPESWNFVNQQKYLAVVVWTYTQHTIMITTIFIYTSQHRSHHWTNTS